ncbi:aryl-sulfate sulfotransferase [Peptococcaceae bacterium 1198_IL3148]
MSYPSIYPTGVTIYKPEKCWSGYTIFQAKEEGAVLIDMNGAEVNVWKGLHGFPNKLLPGGYVFGHLGERNNAFGMQDQTDLVQVDWDGNIVWKFDQNEFIEDPGEEPQWMARQHHDYQREGNPVGYYVPGMDPEVDGGNTLILCHRNVFNHKISDKVLLDDTILEVDWEGNIVWEWNCNEHFDELGFDEAAKNLLFRDPNMRPAGGGMGDWMHINSMSVLGPNKWYDAGDERFHPDNIIWDARESNIMAIIDKHTGKIVWKVGPYYDQDEALIKLGWIIGQHHVHMIPKGLPGEGNILIFDNGGWAGYGVPNPSSPTGRMNAKRDYSRVLEIDPTTLKIVWQYTPAEAGFTMPVDAYRFYSPFISGTQRLPNGNTLITEGSGGRLIEVTADHEIVWEYISPYWGKEMHTNMIYRAYRAPYDWVPQVERPKEVAIEPVDVNKFRMPGASSERKKETTVAGTRPYQGDTALCVAAGDEVECADEA